jgi:hypothetical protein
MAARDRLGYEAALAAMGVCVATRIPFLLWGEPGAGKTAVVESATLSGWHVETLICSHYEPSDFAGLPVVTKDGTVTLAPPGWAARVADDARRSIVFFDEWTTAAPAVQAAALRPLTHGQVGSLQLPERVSFGAAANPADVAASGWESPRPPPTGFVHIDWALPMDVFTESPRHRPLAHDGRPQPRPDYLAHCCYPRDWSPGSRRPRRPTVQRPQRRAVPRTRLPTPRTWDWHRPARGPRPQPGDVPGRAAPARAWHYRRPHGA